MALKNAYGTLTSKTTVTGGNTLVDLTASANNGAITVAIQNANGYVNFASTTNDYIEFTKYSLERVKNTYYEDLKASEGYKFREKELKRQLLDLKNKYKSQLKDLQNVKLTKTVNQYKVKELEIIVDTIAVIKFVT